MEGWNFEILSLVNNNSRTQKFFQTNVKKMEYLNIILILSEFYNYLIRQDEESWKLVLIFLLSLF